MKVAELQAILHRYNVSTRDVVEKDELVQRVKNVLAEQEVALNTRQENEKEVKKEQNVTKEEEETERKEEKAEEATVEKKGSPPKELDSDDEEKELCVICLDEKIGTVFLECGHMACCVGCSTKLVTCPICRRPITRVINVFHVNK